MAYENYGPGVYGPYYLTGAPVAGTNEVQTLTFGGAAVTGGSITITLDGIATAPIPASATAATFVAAINAALDAKFGAGQIVASAGTYAAGAGTILLTFSGSAYARRAVNNVVVTNNLTPGGATVTAAETTPGVTQSGRDFAPGAQLVDVAGKKAYINTGTAGAPAWTVTGSQT